MDIRITNTKNNLVAALLTCLEEKSIRELKVKDIIQASGVSTRTFYQYYSDVNSLVNDVEDDFIAGYTESVRKDRDILNKIDLTMPAQDQLGAVLNSTKNTISFCFEHKKKFKFYYQTMEIWLFIIKFIRQAVTNSCSVLAAWMGPKM